MTIYKLREIKPTDKIHEYDEIELPFSKKILTHCGYFLRIEPRENHTHTAINRLIMQEFGITRKEFVSLTGWDDDGACPVFQEHNFIKGILKLQKLYEPMNPDDWV
jgi:hypothetical protein